jgi:hypothetical protein
MTLPNNDNFAKRELSIGELEAIVGGIQMNSTLARILATFHYHAPHAPQPWMGGLPGRGGANGNPF